VGIGGQNSTPVTLFAAAEESPIVTTDLMTQIEDLRTTLGKMEVALGSISEAMFVTIFLGILNTKTGELVYTNAGHNPPYLKRANGSIKQFDKIHGLPLGVIIDQDYGESKTCLAKEDILLLYTDGVTEAMDRAQNFFSDQRLAGILSSCGDISTEGVVNRIVSEVERFQDDADQGDDITVLAVQYLGTAQK
jgi:sigma-B regulation protein RsbU (phosphoserine phosphatase)